jgi:hypothetical protein
MPEAVIEGNRVKPIPEPEIIAEKPEVKPVKT